MFARLARRSKHRTATVLLVCSTIAADTVHLMLKGLRFDVEVEVLTLTLEGHASSSGHSSSVSW